MKRSSESVASTRSRSRAVVASSLRWARLGVAIGALALVAGLAAVAPASAQATAPSAATTIIEVQHGDTFSGIAARFTGGLGSWRKMYRPELSNLPNPNMILVGMRFEVATDSGGERYLRLTGPGAESPAAAAPRSAPIAAAPPPPPPPRSVAPPAPVAAPTPAAVAAPPAAVTAPAPPPALATPAVPPLAAAVPADDALVIGVLPNIATAALVSQYEHLKRYLERVNGQKVRIVVPANFKAFFDSMMKGEYDLSVAAPHFARLAQVDRNLVPLLIFEPRINALFVAPIEGSVGKPADIRERVVAYANPQSLVAMYGQQWLRGQNLEPGRDFEVKAARTDLGVGRMLLVGDAVAAIMSNGEFRAIPPEENARLKIVEVFARIPNFIVLGHPRIERDRLARLKGHLKGFLVDPEDGVPFGRATGFTGMVDADESQLRELDAFVPQTRRAMGLVK